MNDSPFKGVFGTVACFITGSILHLDTSLQSDISFWLQSFAFIATIIAALVTSYAAIKKLKK